MASQNKLLRILSVLVLSLGVLLGIALTAIAAWGDFEANRFDTDLSLLRDASLRTFRCPVIMTTNESGTVSATLRNPLDRPVTLTVRLDVSSYITLKRENTVRIPLAPGERQKLEWTVTPDDVVYGDLILVKILQLRQYPLPGRLGSCGIVVVDSPYFTGGQIVALGFGASLLAMLGAIALWLASQRPLTRRGRQSANTMAALAASVVVGMICSLLGAWMLAVLLLAANILLIGAIIGHFMSGPTSP